MHDRGIFYIILNKLWNKHDFQKKKIHNRKTFCDNSKKFQKEDFRLVFAAISPVINVIIL